ncbi:heparinase II/III domain-containing protein [Carboxylicivirga linearis]|uniref:Heparinase II/III family protein n=1 Tax=Carboxylicivirga linearis TaxID=1628157 RepID=A0ABS5JWH2_9BACT|nr:heparinase II/III family protein [Carboxylicivirga linearis]MBS2098696.1 heparinase II/III family protein [Carboxylicivirga linearis]
MSLITVEAHNYLLHTDDNINRLKRHITTNESVKRSWLKIRNNANELVKKDHLASRECATLALAYRMTENEKYADALKRILLDYIHKTTWEGKQLLNRNPPWQAGLDVSHTSFDLAIAYDCIYEYLNHDERRKIAEGIVRLGIKPAMDDWLNPETSIHTFDTMGHNWWGACVYMAGFASLAVKNEIPEATEWAINISQTINEWVSYQGSVLQNKPSNFDRDGGFYEGINYASYGFSQYMLFRYAFQNSLPDKNLPDVQMMEKMADFFIYTTYYTEEGSSMCVNFGDTDIRRNGNSVVLLLWNLGHQSDLYAWYLQRVNSGNHAEGLESETPLGLIFHPELPLLPVDYAPEKELSKMYSDIGWVVMRDSWQNNSTMLAVKSGFSWNHAHADAGSFILFHKGKNLIIDSGNSSYGHPSYTQYYVQSEAHNVITWNEKAQEQKDQYYGVSNSGSVNHLIDNGFYKYVMADATGPTARYFSRNHRHFLWVGDVILIIDEVESYEPGSFEWLLHYNGESKRNGIDLTVKEADAEIKVRPLFPNTFPDGGLPHDFPEKIKLKEKIGLEDHQPKNEKPYWSVYQDKITDKNTFVTAIILSDNEKRQPVIKTFDGKDMQGVSIAQGDEVTKVFINLKADGRIKHRNSINSFDGWETDAWITAVTFNSENKADINNCKSCFIAHGSYLRNEDRVLLHGLSKYVAAVEWQPEQNNITIDSQIPFKLSVNQKEEGQKVYINNVDHAVDYNRSNRLGTVYMER